MAKAIDQATATLISDIQSGNNFQIFWKRANDTVPTPDFDTN